MSEDTFKGDVRQGLAGGALLLVLLSATLGWAWGLRGLALASSWIAVAYPGRPLS